MDFCDKLTESERGKGRLPADYKFTLPTEAQWEYVCSTSLAYGEFEEFAWAASNSGQSTHPVQQKKGNAWGLYDLNGNVSEWCLDWYQENYEEGDSSTTRITDPKSPRFGSERVHRGGSVLDDEFAYRPPFRGHAIPAIRSKTIGFRLVIVPSE